MTILYQPYLPSKIFANITLAVCKIDWADKNILVRKIESMIGSSPKQTKAQSGFRLFSFMRALPIIKCK